MLFSCKGGDRRGVWCSLGHLFQQTRHWRLGAEERWHWCLMPLLYFKSLPILSFQKNHSITICIWIGLIISPIFFSVYHLILLFSTCIWPSNHCLFTGLYLLIFNPLGMNTLIGYDLVPEAKILDSALRACRRLDDLASAIRILEAVKVSSCTLVMSSYTLVRFYFNCHRNWAVAFEIFDLDMVETFKCGSACKGKFFLYFAGQGWQPQRHLPLPNPRAETHLVRTWHFNTRRAWHWQVIDHRGKTFHLQSIESVAYRTF